MMSLAWHIEALHRSKRLPKLQKLLMREPTAPKPRQTWQEQDKIMEQWAAHMQRVEAQKRKPN